MVKNTTGGSKHKGFARKEFSASSNNKLRLSESEDEKYAHITKMFGNGMCQAYCDDLKTRTCIIRGKFRGKGKRNSFVTLGAIVLVGIREWETDSDKCDLLEVYGSNEIEQLKHHPKVPVGFLSLNVLSHSTLETDESGINFSNIVEEEVKLVLGTKEDFVMDDSETINIDDI
jgi:translation initiation factor 1A